MFSVLSSAQLVYFAAEAVYVLPVWLTWLIRGPGRAYGAVYSVFGSLVLLAAMGVAWESLIGRDRTKAIVISGVIVSGFTHLAYVGLPTIHWWDVLLLTEASGFLWAGTILLFSVYAARRKQDAVNFVLGVYWLSIAAFNFGFLLHWPNWFIAWNWFPQIMELVAFAVIGVWLWRKHDERRTSCIG